MSASSGSSPSWTRRHGLFQSFFQLPQQLSGGQQQRVALGRALAAEADLLLLDEPLSNLDARLRAHMRGELRQLVKQSQTTAIYVTHDQTEALSMADRAAVMPPTSPATGPDISSVAGASTAPATVKVPP
ncbi:hypothetical protein LCGC14_2318390, partial [marine sediment metagenome]